MVKYFFALIFVLLASFFKCVVDSKVNLEFFTRRSKCDVCDHQLNLFDLIPIFSFLFLKGRCRYCGNKITKDIFYYELSAAILAIIYLVTYNYYTMITTIDISLVLVLIFLSIEDIKTLEVNSKLFIILGILIFIKIVPDFTLSTISSFLVLATIYHIMYYFFQNGMGYGDIKLLTMLSFTTTTLEGFYLLVITFLYAGFYAVFLLLVKEADKKTKVALVPFICMAYITILINRELLIW